MSHPQVFIFETTERHFLKKVGCGYIISSLKPTFPKGILFDTLQILQGFFSLQTLPILQPNCTKVSLYDDPIAL